jgi:hypothetical protein
MADDACPKCGGEVKPTGTDRFRISPGPEQELDPKVQSGRCQDCGATLDRTEGLEGWQLRD